MTQDNEKYSGSDQLHVLALNSKKHVRNIASCSFDRIRNTYVLCCSDCQLNQVESNMGLYIRVDA